MVQPSILHTCGKSGVHPKGKGVMWELVDIKRLHDPYSIAVVARCPYALMLICLSRPSRMVMAWYLMLGSSVPITQLRNVMISDIVRRHVSVLRRASPVRAYKPTARIIFQKAR